MAAINSYQPPVREAMRRSDTPDLLRPESSTAGDVRPTPAQIRTESNNIEQIRTGFGLKNLKKPERT